MKRRKINKNVIAPGVQIFYINELRHEVTKDWGEAFFVSVIFCGTTEVYGFFRCIAIG